MHSGNVEKKISSGTVASDFFLILHSVQRTEFALETRWEMECRLPLPLSLFLCENGGVVGTGYIGIERKKFLFRVPTYTRCRLPRKNKNRLCSMTCGIDKIFEYKEINLDLDRDDVGDLCDNCPNVNSTDQGDTDVDGVGDVCDIGKDQDADSMQEDRDNCPSVANRNQHDADADGIGDLCDRDADNDGTLNENENDSPKS